MTIHWCQILMLLPLGLGVFILLYSIFSPRTWKSPAARRNADSAAAAHPLSGSVVPARIP